jgi:hypothetical protein
MMSQTLLSEDEPGSWVEEPHYTLLKPIAKLQVSSPFRFPNDIRRCATQHPTRSIGLSECSNHDDLATILILMIGTDSHMDRIATADKPLAFDFLYDVLACYETT